MSRRSRAVLLASLVPAFLLAGGFGVAHAQNAGAPAVQATKWSDPATWPNRTLPAAGDKVVIAKDQHVILDISPPALGGLTIEGKLTFSNDVDLELTTEWIVLHGELEIGTPDRPHTRNAAITFTNDVPDENVMGMGDRGIMIMGGTLNLHGDRTHTWTKLAATAEKGATQIEVLDASGWRVGDEIVLASTDYNPRQAEVRRITAIRGNRITLDRPLEWMHFGKITFEIDERGEVGLLTRNIKIRASEDAEETYFGGHIMAMAGSTMHVSGVELSRMGQHLTLARYPIHWHLVGDATGQYIKNSAIHDTWNRCVTVHGTHNLRIENNVTYNNVGHCFFLEDGIETGNEFVRNLAIQTKCHPTKPCMPVNLAPKGEAGFTSENRMAYRETSFFGGDVLLPSDNTVSSFWITNPDNTFIDNVAAGSDANGFWLSLPEHPIGAFEGTEIAQTVWPRRTPLREFRGNVAHSNYDGFMFDRNINEENAFGLAGPSYMPKENPADPSSKGVQAHFENLTTYKNRHGGVWGRGELHVFRNLKSADNAIGFTHSSGSFGADEFTSRVIDSLFVGETENIGNPVTPEEKAYGRSLPKPLIPDYPIRAYEYYDYRHDVINTTFVNYQDNELRRSGALSWLLYTGAGVTTENTISGAKFVSAKPVYFPKIDWKFDSDNRNAISWRSIAIHDLDGSTTGIPDSYILLHDGENNSVATDDTCEIHPDWNAAVCTGDIGRVAFGLFRRGATRGAGLALPDIPRRATALARMAGPAPAAAAAPAPATGPGAGPAPQPPIVLSRNGTDHEITGMGTTVRAGTEVRVKTERPELTISLSEMAEGSWVVFELPGFTEATSGKQQASLDALRKATETSFYKAPDAVWVKLVIPTAPKGVGRDEFGPLDSQTSIVVRR
ncbi:MAG: G8 domain-containing protein [Gammaproteobacteria bacterium]|nr:transmembrane domain-containing protein [Gammaproteobacteria bacterium]